MSRWKLGRPPAAQGNLPIVPVAGPAVTPPPESVAVAEVLSFPVRGLRDLPLPSTLLCSFAHGGGRVALRTGASSPPVPQDDPPVPAFVGPEVDALALAAEHDRAHEATLRGWLERKPEWRLTQREAIGGLPHQPPALGWTTGQVLHVLGLRLDEVWL